MARFLKLTNAYGISAGKPAAINIEQIVSITPYKVKDSSLNESQYTNANCLITTTLPEEYFIVQETFDRIMQNIPI